MKIKTYTGEFKLKVIKEVLREEKTLNEIASKYSITPKNIQNWKRIFEQRGNQVFEEHNPDVEKYRKLLKEREKALDEAHRQLGKLSSELNWAKKKSEEAKLH